ncbi:MAG: excinuclease subunit protein putative endonuclease [Patescibacteria group bacterium]|nr:excinuclease subunit protein putative endonuclease [Patescibacteria group bacterium]
MKDYYVYILASQKNGTLYIGVTGNLQRRIHEHKHKVHEGFTAKYNVSNLVYFERTQDVHSALARETRLKNWKREWKIDLIEKENPDGHELSADLF